MSTYSSGDLSRVSSVQRIDNLDLDSSLFQIEDDPAIYGFKEGVSRDLS